MPGPNTTEEDVSNSAAGLPNLPRPKTFGVPVEKLGVVGMWEVNCLWGVATGANGRKILIRRHGSKG